MIDFIIGFLKERNINYKPNVDLSRISTVRIGPIAPLIIYPKSEDELVGTIGFLNDNSVRYLVLGGISNTLVLGKQFDGIIISLKLFSSIFLDKNRLDIGAGVSLSKAILFAADRSLGGAESLRWIPGTVGAAVCGNAGASGTEICDLLLSATIYDPSLRKVETVTKAAIEPQYRKTALQHNGSIVISAMFAFFKRDKADILRDFECAKRLRLENQPLDSPSLGSVFKRHQGIGAGYYIDRAGLKGTRIGGVQVSKKHAGFFINLGGATAEDYLELIELVKSNVLEKFGIILEEEIKIIR